MSDLSVAQRQPHATPTPCITIAGSFLSFMKHFFCMVILYAPLLTLVGITARNIPLRHLSIYGGLMIGGSGLFLFLGQLSASAQGTDSVRRYRLALSTFVIMGVLCGAVYVVRGLSEPILSSYILLLGLGVFSLLPLAGLVTLLDSVYVSAVANAAGEHGDSRTSIDLIKSWVIEIKHCILRALSPNPTPEQLQPQDGGRASTHEMNVLQNQTQGKVWKWFCAHNEQQITQELQASHEKLPLLDHDEMV